MGKVGSRMASSSFHSSNGISSLISSRGGLVDILIYHNQCHQYYTLENPLMLGALELNAFNHLWTYQVSNVFPLLSSFVAEHVTG